jgi:ankyrin repeat protein
VTPSTLLNNGTTPIITLVRKNDIEYIDAYRKVVTDFDLLKEIKLTDVQGRNVLHYARKPEIINLFVKLGVDVNAKDKLGFTPLYYAKQGDLLSGCVEALVKAGAKE